MPDEPLSGIDVFDPDGLFTSADQLERQARGMLKEARATYSRADLAGSLDAKMALSRLAAESGEFQKAAWQLNDARRRFPDAAASRFVSVAPGVVGRELLPDGANGDSDWIAVGGLFTILSPDPQRAAAAVARVAPRLLNVDEHGEEHTEQEVWDGQVEAYTPNYLDDVKVCNEGVLVLLDTKGEAPAAMHRTMVDILTEALVADGVPAHIAGHCPALQGQWRVWQDPATEG